MEVTAARMWAERTFSGVDLGDRRRTARLVESAAAIAAHPEKPFTQIFDWNDLRGFYRLCNRKEATLSSLMSEHWQQTLTAMRGEPVVLIIHDTTELDFTEHLKLLGTGPIGDGKGKGFLQHNSLAIVPGPRRVLGLAYQQLTTRKPAPEGETSAQRKQRERESVLWLNGINGSGPAPEGSCWVDVGDRGCDIYEAMVASRALNHHFEYRLTQNRQVFVTAEHDRMELLLDYARTLPSKGSDEVDIPGRGGRPPRLATVNLASVKVWVPAPKDTPKRWSQPIIEAWAVRVWEPNPPSGVEPLEWLLLTSIPRETLEELKECRNWYADRWSVEVFHDIEKNGCSEEDRRFETAEGMEPCLAILSLVAVRIFQMRCSLDNQPDAPAEEIASQSEIEVIRRFNKADGNLTVRDFVVGVAKLGGFLGRKRDGLPGVRTLWRGYQRLQDMLVGFNLHSVASAYEDNVGNR
jgi:hypothetical protein